MATSEWDDNTRPLPGPLPKPSRVPPLSTLYDKAAAGTATATDVARTLIGGPAAMAAGFYQSPLQALSAGPGYLYRKYAEGDQQAADAYWNQNVKPAEENMYSAYKKLAEPTTKQGKQFESDVSDIYDYATGTLKVPHLFPGLTSGIPHRGITPTDVRVMGAEAQRVGRQVRDIPTDFKNAQSGLQRIDPVTGKPTLGAKLQGTVESVGDTLSRASERSDMSPLSAVSALMPDTNMYAVRPVGTRILRAQVPKGGAPFNVNTPSVVETLDPLAMLNEGIGIADTTKPFAVLNSYLDRYANLAPGHPTVRHAQGIHDALTQLALEKYPDAPGPHDALAALTQYHGGAFTDDSAKTSLEAVDMYAKSPEAAAAVAAGAPPIPTVDEYLKMHEASDKWRTNNLPNFIIKNLGTEADPSLLLATQGITYKRPAQLLELGDMSAEKARKNRRAAGMPITGAVQEVLNNKAAELSDAVSAHRALGNTADPDAQRAALDKVNSLRNEVENLKLGAAYENIADASVRPDSTENMLAMMDYPDKQYFPSLTRETNPDAMAYQLSKQSIARLGFEDIAKQMHEDILNGKIPVDKVQNMTVEKYIKENAEARIAAEAAEKAQYQLYIDRANRRFADMAQDLPPDAIKLGNTFVLESTQATPYAEVLQRASDDTGVLDHCAGQGGSASRKGNTVHPFTGRSTTAYEPIFMLDEPGKRNPNASGDSTGYTRAVQNGEAILGHVRDAQTGLPVVTIQLKTRRRRDGTQGYTLGYVSGPAHSGGTNGPIGPEYQNDVRDYLNRYADKITGAETYLIDNTQVRDTTSENYDAIGVEAGYRDNRDLRAAYPDLPRFITLDDAHAIRNGTYVMPEPIAASTALATQPAVAPVPAPTSAQLGQQIADHLDIIRHALDEDYGNNVADRAIEIAYDAYDGTIARGDTPAAFAQVLREHAERTLNANLEDALNSIALDIEHGAYAPVPLW